jgi:PAS domain S-box-containing protein
MNRKNTGSQELAILKGAVENTNEAFVTIDANHTVIFYNRGAEKIFGFRREEVMGKDLNIILSPRCSKEHRQAVERYLKSKVPRRIGHESELIATRKNGETFPASISFSVAHIQGRPFFTAIIRDLTETHLLQEQVAKAERLAALGQIVAEITHDIKTPLLMMGAYARQLMRRAKDRQTLSKLNLIAEEVKRLESLLGEMNDYYLLKTLKVERFDIHDLLKEVCSLAQQDCAGKNIQMDCQTLEGSAWVEGDRDKWKQVFLNLIRNGMEALEKGGNITLQSRTKGEHIEISIRDSGPGIPPHVQPEIFTPFFTTKEKGTGLGLPICKRIVECHPGSSIEVFSEKGEGTEVRLTLPRFNEPDGKGHF